ASPKSSASTTEVAFAFGPIEDTNEARVAGPRELLTPTWCPALANSFAAVPPMCPAPMTPIRITTPRAARTRPRAMGFRMGAFICFVHRQLEAAVADGPQLPGTEWNGDARAACRQTAEPLRLLPGPAQGPMDRLLERVRCDRLRLRHGLHHGVFPGDRPLATHRLS